MLQHGRIICPIMKTMDTVMWMKKNPMRSLTKNLKVTTNISIPCGIFLSDYLSYNIVCCRASAKRWTRCFGQRCYTSSAGKSSGQLGGKGSFNLNCTNQGPVVQKLDSAIHRINHYPTDKH